MRAWLILLVGPMLWAAHFLAIYAIASVAVLQGDGSLWWRQGAILGVTLIVLALLVGAFLIQRRRGDDLSAFHRAVSIAGIVLGAIGVAWQSLPAIWL